MLENDRIDVYEGIDINKTSFFCMNGLFVNNLRLKFQISTM